MCICKYCGKEFSSKSIGGHVSRCKMNPNYQETIKKDKENLKKANELSVEVIKQPRLKFNRICPKCGKEFIVIGTQREFDRNKLRRFCSKSCANSRNHSEETRNKTANSLRKYYGTHDLPKGFPRYIDRSGNTSRYKTYTCKYCGKSFTMNDDRDTGGRKYCSSECREKWRKEFANLGGCRKGSGRGKSGWYKGIYCSSTWELAYLIYCLDHNIPIKRCKEKRSYIYEGKLHNYYPDFITDRGIIEIKGYSTHQWLAKQEQNPDVITLYKSDIQPYLKYVHDNYTNDIVSLYDNEKPMKPIGKHAWIHNDIKNMYIKSNKLEEYINSGWIRGRKNFK